MSNHKFNQIKRLYNNATEHSIEQDLSEAISILKSLPDEDTRARVAVFMDGLSQMRSEWRLDQKQRDNKKHNTTRSRGRKKETGDVYW